ncbi:sugar ABC transporter permease [Spongiactinospora sp. TRM90649]|uniref:carbohydrate ABC transporter permease n=1 Tax=Spongiactinospora sp. TRM90649 TaxID=3031114 RepID=UPI0023F75B82|nr:sugar ABC transporter permease [Spongiactinospora sp. TRM90649]MDF5756230.1 sugar ABC transporter permease [Spongiactinospora sp. TRM90649]
MRTRRGRGPAVGGSGRGLATTALLSPAMLILGLFVVVPIGLTFWISLHDWSMFTPLSEMTWRGLGNYQDLLGNEGFFTSLRNTLVYVVLVLVITLPLALALGMLLYFPKIIGKGLARAVLFSTYVVPTVAIAIVWGALYAPDYGPFAQMFSLIGLDPPDWLSDPGTALVSLVIFHVWQMIGYYTILIVAGLTQIPGDLYEAARIDGAGFWRQTVSVTLPLLRRTTTFVALIAAINAIQVFDPVYILTQGGPAESTTVLSFAIQRAAFQNGLAGQASAMAFSLLVVLLAVGGLFLVAMRRRS